jgi:hypothetical protein
MATTDPDAGDGDALIVREVDGEMLVLDTRADLIHRLNPTARLIWRACGGGAEPSGIAAALAAEFDIDPPTALQDVVATVATLRALGLLERLNPGELAAIFGTIDMHGDRHDPP